MSWVIFAGVMKIAPKFRDLFLELDLFDLKKKVEKK